MSLVRGYARGRSWVVAHWRRPHRDEPEQLPMPRSGDESAARPADPSHRPHALPDHGTAPQA